MNPALIQIKNYQRQGLSNSQIADMFGIDEVELDLMIKSMSGGSESKLTADELRNKYKARAIEVAAEIMETEVDNPAARLAACKLILDGEGAMPEGSVERFQKYLEQMKRVTDEADAKVIQLETNNQTPGPGPLQIKKVQKSITAPKEKDQFGGISETYKETSMALAS